MLKRSVEGLRSFTIMLSLLQQEGNNKENTTYKIQADKFDKSRSTKSLICLCKS